MDPAESTEQHGSGNPAQRLRRPGYATLVFTKPEDPGLGQTLATTSRTHFRRNGFCTFAPTDGALGARTFWYSFEASEVCTLVVLCS